jgi:hypothetical protein
MVGKKEKERVKEEDMLKKRVKKYKLRKKKIMNQRDKR